MYNPAKTIELWLDLLHCKENLPVVILIDEYDHPVTTFLPKSPRRAQEATDMLKSFYEQIKIHKNIIHKAFVTDVSKISAVSMFSGGNNFCPLLEKSSEFACLYGFTEDEIRNTYGDELQRIFNESLDDVMTDLKQMYNGYRIHPKQEERIYNSWSVVSALESGSLGQHWVDTTLSK